VLRKSERIPTRAFRKVSILKKKPKNLKLVFLPVPSTIQMPATLVEDRMDVSRDDAGSSSYYRFYSTDDHGSLRVSHPHQEGEVILKVSATQKNAVHKMAKGTLSNGDEIVSAAVQFWTQSSSPDLVYVQIAMARQSGKIDLVSCSEGKKILSINISAMKVNIHRWVGLAIASE
jgi:hypothetical protein